MPSPALSSQQSRSQFCDSLFWGSVIYSQVCFISGHELVQYGQGMGNPQRSLRQHDMSSQGYGRKNMPWASQPNAQPDHYEEGDSRNHYEVQDLFNG